MRLMEEAEGDDREHSAVAFSSSGVSDLRSASEPVFVTDTGASCALAKSVDVDTWEDPQKCSLKQDIVVCVRLRTKASPSWDIQLTQMHG